MTRICHVCKKEFDDEKRKQIEIHKENNSYISKFKAIRFDDEDPIYLCDECVIPYMHGVIDSINYANNTRRNYAAKIFDIMRG